MAGSVSITLDKERQLRFDLNALIDASEASPAAVEAYVTGKGGGLPAVRALLWAGLKEDDRRLTLKTVGDLIQAELSKDPVAGISAIDLKLHEALIAGGLFGGPETKNGKAEPGKPSGSATG